MIRSLAACLVLAALAAPAQAQQTGPDGQSAAFGPAHPLLKSQAVVTGNIVRVGDLVENAGIIANVPIFRAPDLGATGVVPVDAVIEAVRAHALIGLDTGGLNEVVVTRASREIPVADIEASVARALSVRFNLGDVTDIQVRFERDPRV
ncbi:MAG: flagellar basal body P-ring formation protein FlgA, partial [Pseudolabrys sp.]|nr:flagellar basal body P-ring formation protein FlgA [Pseudolabrys sp.]